jgi:protein-disulfide isomerase
MRVALLFACAFIASAQETVVEGTKTSPVRVIAYEDLQCGDCAAYRVMLDEKLLPKYASSVAFEGRDFPLPQHTWARQAAIAARYFGRIEPELGIEFRRFCLSNITTIAPETFAEAVCNFAKSNAADPGMALEGLQDSAIQKQVEKEYQEGIARGVARTPTVFVNGVPFIETFTFEEISKAIDAALAATGKDK